MDTISQRIKLGEIELRLENEFFSEYSLELSSYVRRGGSKNFLERTYTSSSLQLMIDNIKGRLKSTTNDGFYLLDSNFGSGKTHALMTLYEHFKGERVVAIDGHSISDTLWNEINRSLKIEEQNPEETLQALFEKPVLILLDELVVHLKKAKATVVGKTTLSDLTLAFLHTLLVEAKKHQAAIVLTTPGDEVGYDGEVKELIQSLKGIALRQSTVFETTKSDELISILKRQLFKKLPNGSMTYPFNSNFIEFVAEELVPMPNFQAVRGALRLLSKFVRSAPDSILWKLGDIDVEDEFYEELVIKLGHDRLGTVFRRDIQNLEKDLIPGARTVFLNTIARGGISRKQLIESLNTGEPTVQIEEICDRLETSSHHIHVRDGEYYYSIVETPLKRLKSASDNISNAETLSYLAKRIRKLFDGDFFKIHTFDLGAVELDRPNILLDLPGGSDKNQYLLSHKYRNIIFMLECNKSEEVMRLGRMNLAGKHLRGSEYRKILDQVSANMDTAIFGSYTKLRYSKKGKLQSTDINFIASSESPQKTLKEQMIAKHIIIESLSPKYLKSIIEEKEIGIEAILEMFARDNQQRVLLSSQILVDTLEQGNKEKLWVFQDGVVRPYLESPAADEEGLQTNFINSTEFPELMGKTIHDYSYSQTIEGKPASRELIRVLGMLKLIQNELSLDCGIVVASKTGSKVTLEFSETPIAEVYLTLKRTLPSLKDIKADWTKITLQVNEFTATKIDSKLVKAFEGIHTFGGEVFVTTSN